MAEIKWTAEAEYWLKQIYNYIALDNPSAAKKVVQSIHERVQFLKRLPEQGYKYFRYPEHNIRILLFGHYRIAYLVKSHDEIFILGIFHGALDIDKYLFNGDKK